MLPLKKKGKRKKSKKVPLTPQRKKQIKFHKDILNLFRLMGFEYIRTEGKHQYFAGVKSDLDSVFLFKNIIVICEETIGKSNTHDHLRKKYEYYNAIRNEKINFLNWLKQIAAEKFSKFEDFTTNRYKIAYIYITEDSIEENTRNLYSNFKYIDQKSLRYFLKIADSIKYSARNELYKFIGLTLKDIGNTNSGNPENIQSAVIFPEDVSGMPIGIHLVSFVMKAKELLDCAYVFRKENWEEDSGYYYQRLMDKSKVEKIRTFLATEQRTFIDSIIVSLPQNSKFFYVDEDGNKGTEVNLSELSEVTSNVCIEIPYKINSIGIIDGQHRVFGHHENVDNKEERIIADLRNKRHLFVTGLFYQRAKFTELEKRKFESKLFLEINSKQKKVSTQILQHIESLQDPFSPIGISTEVIRRMNKRSPFLNHFLLSELDNKGIKTATIIKYGLQQLVEISDSRESLFKYWANNQKAILITERDELSEELLKKYISYCSATICRFFLAIKNQFDEAWTLDNTSKLLTVTSIVAFLKSFEHSLETYQRIQETTFYQNKLEALEINFLDTKNFPYVSSQWPKFAEEINRCWT